MAEHFLSKAHVHTRWDNRLPPALEIASGDVVEFECFDSSGGQVTPASTLTGNSFASVPAESTRRR
jgi:acetamidase/formamidase